MFTLVLSFMTLLLPASGVEPVSDGTGRNSWIASSPASVTSTPMEADFATLLKVLSRDFALIPKLTALIAQ